MPALLLQRWRLLGRSLPLRVCAVKSIVAPAYDGAISSSSPLRHTDGPLSSWHAPHQASFTSSACPLDESSFERDALQYKDEVFMLSKIISKSDWNRAMDALVNCGIRITAMHVVDVIKMEKDPKVALRFFVWAGHQEGYVHNAFAINAITRIWGHEKDFKAFLDILGNMHLEDYSMTPAKYLVLIKGYGWAGLTDVAMDVLDWMMKTGRRPNEKHFTCLLNALLKEHQFQTAESVFQKMRQVGVPQDVFTYTVLIDGSCKAKQIKIALDYFSEMVRNGVRPDAVTYAALFDGLCQNNEVEKSLRVYEDMKVIQLDSVALNALMTGLCNHGHIDKASSLLTCSRHKPDARTYTILVGALCSAKKFKDARTFVDQALARGIVFEVATCATLLESLCEDCKGKEALDLINKLLTNRNIPDGTGNKVLASLSRNGESYSAYNLWYNILRYNKLSGDTYEALLNGLCKEGRLLLSKQVYNDMISKGFAPSVNIQGQLLDGFCRAGNFDEGWMIFNRIVENGGVPNVDIFNSLIHGFSKAAKLPKAMQALQCMEDAGISPTSVTFLSLINGYCRIQSPESALPILNRMLRQGFTPDVGTYTNLVRALCKAKMTDEGYKLIHDMKAMGCAPSFLVYDDLIKGLCQLDRVDAAHQLVLEMLGAGCTPTKLVIEEILLALQRLDRVKDVEQLIELLGREEEACMTYLIRSAVQKPSRTQYQQ